MSGKLIAARRAIVETAEGTRILAPAAVRVEGGRVVEVHEGEPSGDPDVILEDGYLAPGLIDLQVNGYFGVDFVDAGPDEWERVVRRMPETGVTAFAPTFITAPVPALADALRTTAALLPQLTGGARVLGVHVEGPFLSAEQQGAHNEQWLADPEPGSLEKLLDAGGGSLALLTLAPERPGAMEAIRRADAAGVCVSIGHSDATADQVHAAADAGARMVTHLFNAQRGLHHREPGVVGRGLTDQRLACGLIADLHHVYAEACVVAFRAAPGRICLVTDALAAAGMAPGRYVLGGEPVVLPFEGPAARDDGTIAGSALRLDLAIANMVGLGIDVLTAVDAATRVPAGTIGRPDLGRIAAGAAADLVWLGDDLRTRATWVAGECAYRGSLEMSG